MLIAAWLEGGLHLNVGTSTTEADLQDSVSVGNGYEPLGGRIGLVIFTRIDKVTTLPVREAHGYFDECHIVLVAKFLKTSYLTRRRLTERDPALPSLPDG